MVGKSDKAVLYEYDEKWEPVLIRECDCKKDLAGCLSLEQLEENCRKFSVSQSTLDLCLSNSLLYRKGLQSLEQYSFCILPLFPREEGKEERDKIGVLFSKTMCLIIILQDESQRIEPIFEELINRPWKDGQLAKLLYTFLDELLEQNVAVLENMDFHIARLEEKLVKAKTHEDFHNELFIMKKKLLLFRSYYEQLLEVGERLYGNDNGILNEEDREMFQIFTERVQRLRDNVMFLKDSLVEVREAYESYVDYNMNVVMKYLTVSTSFFMPLTFMTGWYGMNFKHMPEIKEPAAYPLFFIAVIVILGIIYAYFRRKKFL